LIETCQQFMSRQHPAVAPAPAASTSAAAKVRSTFSDDADMADIIGEFVSGLPKQVESLSSLLQQRNLDELRRAVHQLKGAGGGYGFNQITEMARNAEQTIAANEPLDRIVQQVNDLTDLLQRVEGYTANTANQ
jgi:HPt (histidine-containing phosphotransfer) domain-containing protein